MVEIVLSVLLAVASAFGVVFWRKSQDARENTRRQIDEVRTQAREENAAREEVIRANIQDINGRVNKIQNDRGGRQALADLLNDD